MSLVERAKRRALEAEITRREEERSRREERARLESHAEKLGREALDGLREFDGVACRPGCLLKLVTRVRYHKSDCRVAVLCLLRDGEKLEDLLFLSAGVESGVFDASDDCRDIPYTCAYVTITSPTDERDMSTASPGPFSGRATVPGNADDGVKRLLEKVADYLAPLFASPGE